jgi:hypothetical protein
MLLAIPVPTLIILAWLIAIGFLINFAVQDLKNWFFERRRRKKEIKEIKEIRRKEDFKKLVPFWQL